MKVVSDPSTDWQRFGETDPYWAVLTEPKFRRSNIDADARAEFFASGERHLQKVVETIRNSVDDAFAPARALDFGCGVGRVLIPMARRFPAVVGTDVAESMLREAGNNLREQGVRADLVLADDGVSRVTGLFDFIHSYIVFQHIPPAPGLILLDALLERLAPGGVGALHFTYLAPLSSRQRALRWLRHHAPLVTVATNLARGRSASAPYMELYEYNLELVFEKLRGADCVEFQAHLTDHGGLIGALIFFKKPRATPAPVR